MESRIEEIAYCYVGRQPGCRCLGVVVVDSQEHAKDTAKTVADMVKSGLIIERMTVEDFRNCKDHFGCMHKDMKMKECLEARTEQGGSMNSRHSTPKQRVLKKYAEAVCITGGPGWVVFHRIDTAGGPIGRGATPRQAWADAYKRTKGNGGGMYA